MARARRYEPQLLGVTRALAFFAASALGATLTVDGSPVLMAGAGIATAAAVTSPSTSTRHWSYAGMAFITVVTVTALGTLSLSVTPLLAGVLFAAALVSCAEAARLVLRTSGVARVRPDRLKDRTALIAAAAIGPLAGALPIAAAIGTGPVEVAVREIAVVWSAQAVGVLLFTIPAQTLSAAARRTVSRRALIALAVLSGATVAAWAMPPGAATADLIRFAWPLAVVAGLGMLPIAWWDLAAGVVGISAALAFTLSGGPFESGAANSTLLFGAALIVSTQAALYAVTVWHERHRDRLHLAEMIAQTPDAYAKMDAAGRVLEWNPRAEVMTGWRADEVIGQRIWEFLAMSGDEADRLHEWMEHRARDHRARPHGTRVVSRIAHRSGEIVPVEVVFNVSVAGDTTFHAFAHDISERMHRERRLRAEADRDPLTGLSNRRAFDSQVDSMLRRARSDGDACSVICIDVDRFKQINDTYGHAAGDSVLRGVGRIISAAVSPGDIAARLGGDEFVIVLPDGDTKRAENLAWTVITQVRHEVLARADDQQTIDVSLSIGVAEVLRRQIVSAANVIMYADSALYEAKQAGRDQIVVHEPSTRSGEENATADWAHLLRFAIDEEAFELFQLPVVPLRPDVHSCRRIELLLRLRDAHGGLVTPDDFLETATRHRMMFDIDAWVLDRAGALLSADPELTVHVNVSDHTISDRGFAHLVARILTACAACPSRLVIEVAENAMAAMRDDTRNNITALSQLGVQIAVDDFGSGRSGLAYLETVPVDIVKLNRSMVAQIARHEQGLLAEAMIGLAHRLKITMIATGVETKPVAGRLAELGVRLGQGYLYGEPLALAEHEHGAPGRSERFVEDARSA